MAITNDKLKNYPFLKGMYTDGYFPDFLVDKGVQILVRLCEAIETQQPKDVESLLVLTHAATNEFNLLAEEFVANDSDFETEAREITGADFDYIVKAYGFNVNVEDVIATRDW